MNCPINKHTLRPELPPLTRRLAALPVDDRGYPVPFFVAYVNGKPEFRMADPKKLHQCIRFKVCWVCGENLGTRHSFVIGPMCIVNRIGADAPSHPDCAEWSVKGCPFLSKPKMVRREDDLTRANKENVAGIMIERNPGVMAIWTTRQHTLVRDPAGALLFSLGDPESVTWWREGRPATRAEVIDGIATGLPTLLDACRDEEEKQMVQAAVDRAMPFLPSPSRKVTLAEFEAGMQAIAAAGADTDKPYDQQTPLARAALQKHIIDISDYWWSLTPAEQSQMGEQARKTMEFNP